MCECYQIGGKFVAEDPDCPKHGNYAQSVRDERDKGVNALLREADECQSITRLREIAHKIDALTQED